MTDKRINLSTITGRVNDAALTILAQHPEGVRWTDLLKNIQAVDPTFHPKTVNGCVWKLTEKFPDLVYKPEKGLFRLTKFR